MRNIVLAIIIMLGLSGLARAEDWYGITNKNSCAKASEIAFGVIDRLLWGPHIDSPADIIKVYLENGLPYEIKEESKDGKVVQVTITNKMNYHRITLYRLERCQEVARSMQRKVDEELERYK